MNEMSGYFLLFIPHMLFICLAISTGVVIISKRTKDDNLHQYYSKPRREIDTKRSILDTVGEIIFNLYKESMIICAVIIISIAINLFNGSESKDLYTQVFNISSSLPEELLNWLGIIISLVAMLVAFRKDYYLVFSVADVLGQYKFKNRTLTVLNMMILVKLLEFAKFFSISTFYNFVIDILIIISYVRAIVWTVYLIYRVMDILYTQDKIELKLLDKLYYKVRNKLLIPTECYNENTAGTLINCDYLCQRFMEACFKVDKTCLKNIRLQSVHKEGLDKAYKSSFKIIARYVNVYLVVVTIVYIGIFTIFGFIKNIYIYYIFKMILISWLSWGFIFIFGRFIQKSKFIKIKQIINRMIYSDYIYLSEDSNGNDFITSLFGPKDPGEISGYIKSIINLAIYWKIIISGENKINIEAFKSGLRDNRAFYLEDCKEFDELIYPLCNFIEYISLTVDKSKFWDELRNVSWLENIYNKQNMDLLKEISYYITSLGGKNSVSQSLGEYIEGIKMICKERK